MLLKRFVDVFRQRKQSLDNKGLQLSSRNSKSRLKINLNTIHKKVVFENLYTQRDSSLFVIFVVEHVEHRSLSSLSSMSNIIRLARYRTCQTLFACQVVESIDSRALCYMLRRRLYITLFRARFVTLFLFFKVFVPKVIVSSIMSF